MLNPNGRLGPPAPHLSRLLFFDLETTGTDPYAAHIVELALIPYGPPEGLVGAPLVEEGDTLVELVNPGVPIPTDATEVHGIGDDDVADAPTFAELAPRVQAMVDGRTLVGYNSRGYDTPLLHRHLVAAGQPGLLMDGAGMITHPELDLMRLWNAMEPRTLTGALWRWAGLELGEDAHRAEDDTRALVEILTGMAKWGRHGTPKKANTTHMVERMMELAAPEDELDRAGRFRLVDGEAVLTFGKHQGQPARRHPDYLRWMLGQDFPPDTKAVAKMALDPATEWRQP